MGDDALRQQIKLLQQAYDELLQERDKLRWKIDEIDPSGRLEEKTKIDVDKL